METTDGKKLVDGAWYSVTPPDVEWTRPLQFTLPEGNETRASLRWGSYYVVSETQFERCIIKGPIAGPALTALMWDQICIAAIGGKLQPETLKVIIELGKKEGFE